MHKRASKQTERGSALIAAMIVLGLAAGTVAYLTSRNANQRAEMDIGQASDSAEIGNISNLALMKSLVRFPTTAGAKNAKDATYIPYVYPEPYYVPNPVPNMGQDTVPSLTIMRASPNIDVWGPSPRPPMAPNRNELGLGGFESRGFNATRLESIYRDGNVAGTPQNPLIGGEGLGSIVSIVDIVPGGGGRVGKIVIESKAVSAARNLKGSDGGVSTVRAEIDIPAPPPPMCDGTNSVGGIVDENSAFTSAFRGYGVFTGAAPVINTHTPSCNLITVAPPAAWSIRNQNATGIALNGCNRIARGGAPDGEDDVFWYFRLTGASMTINNNWGGSTGCQTADVRYRKRKPPTCAFTQSTYSVVKTRCTTLRMNVRNAAQSHVYSPSHGWSNSTAQTFCSNTSENEPSFYPNIPGSVVGVDGQTGSCATNIVIPFRQSVCRFHGIWQTIGSCTNGHAGGFWSSARSFAYVVGGSNWECRAHLFAPANCQGAPVYDRIVPGCFVPETKITMADGSMQRIDTIQEGAFIRNPITKKPMRVKKVIAGAEKADLVEYTVDGASPVLVTAGHPVPTQARQLFASSGDTLPVMSMRMKRADEIKVEDLVLGGDGKYYPLTSLKRVPPAKDQIVWNLEIDTDSPDANDRMIEANGFLVTGDFVLQAQVEGVPAQ